MVQIHFQFHVSFVFVGQARQVRCIVIYINPDPTQMIDGTELKIPLNFAKCAVQCNEFGSM